MFQKFLICILILISHSAHAEWNLNLGMNNPHTSNFGLNFLNYLGDWGVEVGLGLITSSNEDDEISGMKLGGGFNGKYFFMNGLFRPYAQVGLGLSSGVTGDGAGAGASGFFAGAGCFIWSSDFHIYASLNLSRNTFFQAGIGFPFK